ncbi:Phosphatidylglycerol/phosphatidylinositol transfer protein [Mactra antiquata]
MVAFLTNFICTVLPIMYFCQDFVVGTKITYTNCGPPSILYVDMAPCDKLPCVFHKGTNATVTIAFNTTQKADAITAKVYGIVAGIPIPYPLPKSNGCEDCNLTCPLQGGQYKYVNQFPVLQDYPDIKIAVKWELVDQDQNPLVCFVFPMEIQG